MTLTLSADELAFLQSHGFNPTEFSARQGRVREGTLTDRDAIFPGTLEPPRPGDVSELPASGSEEAKGLVSLGQNALAAGQVARLVLAGGKATRFGGGVKGAVDVLPGESFLSLHLEDARRAGRVSGKPVPFVIMSSYGSTEQIREHLESRGLMGPDILIFEQGLSVRLTPEGEVFRGEDGAPSSYPPGHGDFFQSFRSSGLLKALRERGVEHLFLSNVDNLGATLDPKVVGHHVRSGADMTIEVTSRLAGDVAGAPVRGDGRLRLLEGFRFPKGADFSRFPEISINSYFFRLRSEAMDVLGGEVPLRHYVTVKNVEGRKAVQMEMITGEATEALRPDGTPVLATSFVRVPRQGRPGHFYEGRFYPVKERSHLDEISRALAFTRLREELGRRFSLSGAPLWYLSASGRINLLGEHTDYSDGLALPAATNRRILGVFQPLESGEVHVASRQFDSTAELSVTEPRDYPRGDWRRYVSSALKVVREQLPVARGFRALIDSDLPPGSGLSSSAALELLLLNALFTLNGKQVDPVQLSQLAQKAEWDVGVKTGLLDQMAIAFGKRGQVSLLDVRALSSTPVPVKLGENQFLVGFTQPRALVGSAYDERRQQVERAAELFRRITGDERIKTLRDVTLELFEAHRSRLSDPKLNPEGWPLEARARHVITENARVLEARDALARGEVDRFKDLMVETHRSLRDDFQVSSPALDAMVEASLAYGREFNVKIGARMMGGGFGGPVLQLVPSGHVDAFKTWVGKRYAEQTGAKGTFWDVSLEDGLSVSR